MMLDLRKFWLATAVYVLIIGVVIAAVLAAFSAFVGMPIKGYQQAVAQTAPIQTRGGMQVLTEIGRVVTTPSPLPQSALVYRSPATDMAVALTPPQVIAPDLQIIVPERKATRRGGPIPQQWR